MDLEHRVISIGALAAHPLWNEKREVRTGHATTTLVTSGDARILVDPSLPAPILTARLRERANLTPERITHVFLTSFEPVRRRAIQAFEHAEWLLAEAEREAIGVTLVQTLREAHEAGEGELVETLTSEVATLQRCKAAPDSIAEGVDLFPLPGVTPGLCGLLLPMTNATVVICGDAVPTVEHLNAGQVLAHAADVERARSSFSEAIEIADVLVLGRDNAVLNPLRRF